MENFGTKKFTAINRETELRAIMEAVYKALQTKGYDPINQLVGYLITEDPTYITGHDNARTLITQVERDELLRELLRSYLPDR
ncbi:MAG: IreB family regulatory phosphoprotein [Oscillospiraceae bacterium]|jgi:uncharacterized protein (UPF0297 family)|nr:IreB family regulatory phosphoprotein [Oscillospiraceae bacterium]